MLDHVVTPNSVNEGSNSATFLASDRCQRQVTQLTFERDIVTGPVVWANVSIWVPECVGIRAGWFDLWNSTTVCDFDSNLAFLVAWLSAESTWLMKTDLKHQSQHLTLYNYDTTYLLLQIIVNAHYTTRRLQYVDANMRMHWICLVPTQWTFWWWARFTSSKSFACLDTNDTCRTYVIILVVWQI
jgi:hypothetical protein